MGKFDIKSSLNEVAGVVQPITTILSGATLIYNLLDAPRQKEAERKEVEERVDFIVNNTGVAPIYNKLPFRFILKNGENQQVIDTYMVTGDKDYGQLVRGHVVMYKPRHGGGYDVLGEKEICEKYSISSTKQVIDILALMGDSADNFPGCPGVGEKTAVKLINEWGSIDNMLEHATEVKGAIGKKIIEHVEDIRMSKFLATIVTDIKEVTDNLPTLLQEMETRQPDIDKLSAIFDELEFKSLAKKIFNNIATKDAQSKEAITNRFQNRQQQFNQILTNQNQSQK